MPTFSTLSAMFSKAFFFVVVNGLDSAGKCLQAISPFPTVFSIRIKNFLPFASNLKLSSV